MTYFDSRFQRASAAFRAAALRSSAVRLAARAFPPLSPPFRPRATAAGSFPSSGSNGGASPVASSTIWRASSFGSVGRLRERSGMSQMVHHHMSLVLTDDSSSEEQLVRSAWTPGRGRGHHLRSLCHNGGVQRREFILRLEWLVLRRVGYRRANGLDLYLAHHTGEASLGSCWCRSGRTRQRAWHLLAPSLGGTGRLYRIAPPELRFQTGPLPAGRPNWKPGFRNASHLASYPQRRSGCPRGPQG